MNEQRIREIANQASTHAEDTVDYYSGIVDGLTWEAKILKARDLKFAELIVRECAKVIVNGGYWSGGLLGPKRGQAWIQCTPPEIAQMIKEHFGVEDN